MILNRFLHSERGIATAYFAVALPAFLAIAALVVDVGRGNNLQFDLQRAVDSLAVAGAAELDGNDDAVERAERAVSTLIANQSRFGQNGAEIVTENDVNLYFLDLIPTNDDAPIDAAWIAAHDARDTPDVARFVVVSAKPTSYRLLFPVALLGRDNVETSAYAVAGFQSAICNVAPFFICNPYEGTATTLEDAVTDPVVRRKLIEIRQKGGGSSSWAPGNFEFLQASGTEPGASALRDLFARANPGGCFGKDGVYLKPGQTTTIRRGLNVRFDIYEGNFNGNRGQSEYRPARSVRKQYIGNTCSAALTSDTTHYRRLPRDNCLISGTCTELGGRMGDGMWDFEAYWTINFPAQAFPVVDGVTWGNASANLPSRYQVYRYEIDHNMTHLKSIGTTPSDGEKGAPVCYSGAASTLTDTPDRRLLYGAIINCVEQAAKMNGGSGGLIPVEAFGSFFVTEPLQNGNEDSGDDTIRAEIVDVTGEFGNGTLQSFIKEGTNLYR